MWLCWVHLYGFRRMNLGYVPGELGLGVCEKIQEFWSPCCGLKRTDLEFKTRWHIQVWGLWNRFMT